MPVSVYNNAPEHRAELIDAAENEIKCCSPVFYPVCLCETHPHECFSPGLWVVGDMRKIGVPMFML